MKKILIIFVMLVIAFVMVGCSSENNNEYYKNILSRIYCIERSWFIDLQDKFY